MHILDRLIRLLRAYEELEDAMRWASMEYDMPQHRRKPIEDAIDKINKLKQTGTPVQ